MLLYWMFNLQISINIFRLRFNCTKRWEKIKNALLQCCQWNTFSCEYTVTHICFSKMFPLLYVCSSSCTIPEKEKNWVLNDYVCIVCLYAFLHACMCAFLCMQWGIICQPRSEEGQGIKDHKKCMTADNFGLLIKICWYDQSLGLSQAHSRDSRLPSFTSQSVTRQLTESGAFSSSSASPPSWKPSN